eukprot:gene1191-15555_t
MAAAACSRDKDSIAWLSKKEDEGTQEEKVDGQRITSVSGCCNKLTRRLLPPHIRTESKALLKLAWGISLNSFLTFFIPVSSVLIVGHKGNVYLAALGLGLSVCNVTGNVFVAGLTSVTETLCSQAYGAGQYKRFGVVIQRSLILTFLAVLPSCALWINLDKILVLLGQDKEVALLASYYGICFIPGLLVSFGIAIGIAVRVGSFLGAGLPQYAKHSVKAGFLVSAAFTVSIVLIVAATKDVIGYLFTSDRAVIEMVSDVIVLAASHQIFDGLQTICIGAIRGIGYQKYGALINFVGYMCVGIPLYILLMFKANIGVLGFWLGAVAGVWSQLFGEIVLLYRADWTELSKLARERAGVVTDAHPFESNGPTVENYCAIEKNVEENKYKSRSKVNDVTETAFIKEENSSLFTPDFPSTAKGDHGISSPNVNAAETFQMLSNAITEFLRRMQTRLRKVSELRMLGIFAAYIVEKDSKLRMFGVSENLRILTLISTRFTWLAFKRSSILT